MNGAEMALADNISVLPSSVVEKPSGLPFKPPARPARWRWRHVALVASFLALVALPVVVSTWYLTMRATDQYASYLAFSVRSEEPSSGLELLGGIANVSGSDASDSDILYDFLGSQQLVERLEKRLDLSHIWVAPEGDPVFTFKPTGHIEDLHDHWARMVGISHDSTRGIIEVRARAFDPIVAQKINTAILEESTELINQINNVARDDAVRYALDDLQRAKSQLASARRALTEFRIENEIVDPALDAEIQSNLIATLDAQLTETLVDIEMLASNTRRGDTRLQQAQTRATVLENRIAQERGTRAIPMTGEQSGGIAELFSAYEQLRVDVEFAEARYQSSRANFDAALSDARRTTRYLAAHILPTLAQKSTFPHRGLLVAVIAGAAFLLWALLALIGFSFLDRR